MKDRDLQQAMEACRPGSDDLELDELKTLAQQLLADADLRHQFAQIQRLDAEISEAMPQVSVPEHLRDAILARLEVSQELTRPKDRSTTSRRWLLAAAGLSSTAALVFVVAQLVWNPPEPLDAAQLAAKAQHEWKLTESWQPMHVGSARPPISRSIRLQPTRWQQIETQLDNSTVVFDFQNSPVPTRLYVMRVNPQRVNLPNRPPRNPDFASEGRLITAWIENDLVYVLNMEGSLPDYREVVRSQAASLAQVSDGATAS